MSQFVVGQWVECIDDHDFRHIRNGGFYRVDAVLGNGDIRLEHVDAIYGANRFRPVEWQVGRTYKTTLESVSATIESVTGESVYGLDSRPEFKDCPWMFDAKTGRLVSYEDSGHLPHITPYLATPDEPKKERFTLGKIVEHWAVFDNEANEHAPFSVEANARSFYDRLTAGNVEKPGGYFWRDNPTKSEQIRDDAAKALENVTGGKCVEDTTAIDKLIAEYEAHAAMASKLAGEHCERAAIYLAMVKRAKELKGGAT